MRTMVLSVAQRTTLRTILIVAALLVGAAGALALGFPPWLRARIESVAAQRGIALKFEDFDASWGQLVLHGVSFQRERPLHLQGTAQRVIIQLDGFQPRAITLETPSIDVLATTQELLAQLNAPNPQPSSSDGSSSPINATALTLNWRAASGATPQVSLTEATLSLKPTATELQGKIAVLELPLGTLQVNWDRAAHQAEIAAISSAWPALRLVAKAKFAADPALITVTLPETTVPLPLSILFGVPALKAASLGARVDLQWPLGLSMQTPGGTASLTLKNFDPPHPVELQGFNFGPQTDMVTDFSLSRDHKKVALKNIRVQAGSFALTGDGSLDASRARVALRGGLSCALLAKAAAEARLGSVFGKWAGKLALQHVEGKVAVEIDAELPFNGVPVPRVQKRVLPGCGLKPLKLEDLAKLQPPELDLSQLGAALRQALPELGNLPHAPNLLPGMPSPAFPGLVMPGLDGKPKQVAPAAPSGAPSASAQP